MGCIIVDHYIEMHDKPQTFVSVVDKKTVHSLVLYGVAICVRYFEFTTGAHGDNNLMDTNVVLLARMQNENHISIIITILRFTVKVFFFD